MTNKQADTWVIKKWVYIYKNNGSQFEIRKRYPEMKAFMCNCAWCERYNDASWCNNLCPLMQIDNNIILKNACGLHTIYHEWEMYETKLTAKAMLDQCIRAIKQTRQYKDFTFIDKLL